MPSITQLVGDRAKTQTPGSLGQILGPIPLSDAAGSLWPHCALKAVSTQPTVRLRPWGPSWVLHAAVCPPFTPRTCRFAVSELELRVSVGLDAGAGEQGAGLIQPGWGTHSDPQMTSLLPTALPLLRPAVLGGWPVVLCMGGA